jgi:exodeoxyribonuclease VII small subunit
MTPTDDGTPTAGPAADDGLAYDAALTELDGILTELEDDRIDVDHLAERVERAAHLIRLCRGRISGARLQVERIVADLEGLADDPGTPPPPEDEPF